MPLQSRNTPRKDAPPQAAADDPPSTPRKQLTHRSKEEFLASNTKPLVKKEDTATTSMLINREALTESSSPSSASRASAAGVSGPLVASLSSRTNASPSTSATAFTAGAEKTSVVVAALVRKESKIPRQKSAIPATRSRKARTPPTPALSSPRSLGEIGGSRSHHWLAKPCRVPVSSVGRGSEPLPCALCIFTRHDSTKGALAHRSNELFVTTFFANFSERRLGEIRRITLLRRWVHSVGG
jgi:hypothetical protein